MKTIIEQHTEGSGYIRVYSDEDGLWVEVFNGSLTMEILITADQLWTFKNKIVLNNHALQAADKPKVASNG